MIICPHCGSLHISKNGKNPSGTNRYQCKDCEKFFTDEPSELTYIPRRRCPNCKSKNFSLINDKSAKHQRYYCKDCKTSFTEQPVYLVEQRRTCPICGKPLAVKGFTDEGVRKYYCCVCKRKSTARTWQKLMIQKNPVTCPHCQGNDIKRAGKLASGTPKFYCKTCQRYFSKNTNIREDIKIHCIHCGSDNLRRCGHSPDGTQRYLCKECGRKFMETSKRRDEAASLVTCPRCGHGEAVKAGHDYGKQYYRCKACGHKYALDAAFRHLTEDTIKQLVQAFLQGASYEQLNKDFGFSEKTLRKALYPTIDKLIVQSYLKGVSISVLSKRFRRSYNIIEELVKDKEQQLSQKQENFILTYGIRLGVPAADIAPHVPCSIATVERILARFEKVRRKRYVPSEEEKRLDRLTLSKYETKESH